MSTVELKIKEQANTIGIVEKKEEKPIDLDKKAEKIDHDEENYLIRSLRKIP